MDARRIIFGFLALAFTGVSMVQLSASSLYKMVDANGVVTFTDVMPSSDAKDMNKSTSAPAAAKPEADPAVSAANEQVDRAEHELALARKKIESQGLGVPAERSRKDVARVDLCKKDLRIAHQQLAEALANARRRATSATS